MRVLATLALLIISTLSHAALNVCPDGISYTSIASNQCPAYRTSLSILDIAQTSATITGVGDAQTAGSTHYYYVGVSAFPPGCTSLNYTYADLSSGVTATRQAAEKARQKCANFKTMIAGTGATSAGSTAVPAPGQFWLTMTGLTHNSAYYAQEFHRGGVAGAGKTSLMSTQIFTTAANTGGGPPPAPGEQAVADSGASARFIGTGGSDLSDGLTDATRWLTLSKVICGLPAGTNIGLLSSSTFQNQELNLCFGSTSGDRAIIGGYKLNGSSVPIWIRDDIFGTGTTDAKPIIKGGLTQGCLDAGSCAYPGTFPAETHGSSDDPVIYISGSADYLTVQNIDVSFHRYRPITADNGTVTKGLTNLIVDGVDIHDNGNNFFIRGATDVIVRNGSAYNQNTCQMQRQQSGATGSTADCNVPYIYSGTPQFIYVERALAEYNLARDIWGECMNAVYGSNYVVFRNNTIGDCASVAIYPDQASHTVIESNILVGNSTASVGYATTTDTRLRGIEVQYEDAGAYYRSVSNLNDQVIRNNLIVNRSTGVEGGWAPETLAADTGFLESMSAYVYGNTIIGTTSRDHALDRYNNPGSRTAYWYLRNNAHWSFSAGSTSCEWRDQGATTTAEYNTWAVTQDDADCNGTGTIVTNTPGFTVSNIATWAAYAIQGTVPTWENAEPAAGSALLNVGTPLTANILDIANFGIAFTQIREVLAGTLTEAEWECGLCVDGQGTTRSNPPDIGAMEYTP